MVCYIQHIRLSTLFVCTAILLACNYFAFQVELFQDEYEANHPTEQTSGDGLSSPTVTWESFDKDNAQKPYIFNALVELKCLVRYIPIVAVPFFNEPPLQAIRDKSPPVTLKPAA